MTSDDRTFDGSFPIVAIGASAGGLYSLECFLEPLPKKFSFAVVFIQHLSAKHKSLLPELLHKRRPDIEIIEIYEGLDILPGKLYLCPPGREVGIRKGAFHVAPLSREHVHLPIDEFFVSLAEEAGERAISVIFSGAGTDGARGIQAVRTMGGTVFVQDPTTAEFPGMPLAAINAIDVDGVLPPDDIAREIVRIHSAAVASAGPEGLISPAEFEACCRLIHEKTGYGFTHYKRNVVSRRIRRRMYLRGVSSVQDYITLLGEKESEAAMLASDLMIGVTSFFRDRLAWKALKIGVIRKLTIENEEPLIRVWTPACATGEEAYSIAMMLYDELALAGKKQEIQVFATDVNDRALEKAREGIYPGSITADMPSEYMRKFFTCSDDGPSVIISKEIRERVVFAKQDILADPPFSRLDLIICRNLLIYLDPEAQEKCLALFHYALRDGGYLFLGNAESVGRNSALFKSLGHKKCRVYQKVEAKSSSRLPLAAPFAQERPASFPSRRTASELRQSTTEFIQEALLGNYAPAAVAINQNFEILYHNGPTNRYLQQPRGTPTQNLLDLLPEKLRTRVRGGLYRVLQETKPVAIRTSIPRDDERKMPVTLRISKLKDDLFLVVFRQRDAKKGGPSEQAVGIPLDQAAAEDSAVLQLESELSATRDALHSNIEQLKSLNEELQSSNEELQAANEELETSKEELQSLNEELITVNSQLQSKIEEQEETNNDLNNFLASTSIPTIFLDLRFRVKRFTPAMARLIKLIPADVGRPILDMSQEHLGPDLISDAGAVLDNLVPIKKELMINNSWYIRAALPYRASDNRIEGVVITYSDITELKRAEENTRHLASFPQLNPNPVLEVDSSGKVTFFNPAAEKILERQGMDNRDVNVFLPSDLNDMLRNWERKNELSLYREVTLKDRTFGESIYLSPQFNVLRIYAYDITEIKKTEEIQGRLAAIVESAEDAIISKDMNGIIQTWNVGAENIFGYAAVEVIGRNISLLVPPGHTDEVPEILKRISRGEHIEHFETVRLRKDGTIIPVSVTYSPIKDAAGKVVGLSKIAHDISGQKRAEEALQQSEERYRSLFENMLHGFAYCKVLYDEGGRPLDFIYLDVNSTFGNLTSLRNVVGKRVTEVIPGIREAHPELLDIYGRVALTGQPERFEIEFKPLELWLSISVYSPAREYFVAIFDDITERKRAEEDVLKLSEDMAARNVELETVNKELESFIYSISHDLRAPLRTMSGFARIVVEDYAERLDEQGKEHLIRILRGSEKMTKLIDDLLHLSRISRQEMERTEFDMSKMASSIVAELRERDPGRSVEADIAEGLVAFADPLLIDIALSNLLGNAWKFTSKTGKARIEFGTTARDGKSIFFVRDNGAGFNPEYVEKMFLPFHRLHSDDEFEGTGIGLTIVERIIHRHGGKVWAEGEKGKGATIYFTLE